MSVESTIPIMGPRTPAFISSEQGQAPVAKMVFHQYGNQYFLSQVWFPEMKWKWHRIWRKADTELVGK